MKTSTGLIFGWRTVAVTARCAAFISAVILKPSFALAQTPAYSATEAPAAWNNYALLVQAHVREWLAGDDVIRRFKEATQDQQGQAKPSQTVVARVWISAAGKIERVAISALDEDAVVKLRTAIEGRDIGLPPPADMPQPLHLKLSIGDEE